MFKKLDFPSPALFLEKTDIIQCNKYLPKYFFFQVYCLGITYVTIIFY